MGRIISYPYRLEITAVSGRYYTPMVWRVSKDVQSPGYGKPTLKNLEKWIKGFEQSTIDGPNKHLGPEKIVSAQIVRQSDNVVMASSNNRLGPRKLNNHEDS